MKIVGTVYDKIKILNFFLMWTTLNFESRSKTKKGARDICKGTLDIEFKRDWSVGFGVMLCDGQKIKNYFSNFRNFSGKPDSVILLGFECTINPQNLMKIVGATFEKIKFFNFFLMWTTPNFRVRGKLKKKKLEILTRGPRYQSWTRSVYRFRLYDRWRSDRHTHTHTFFFLKHIFRL